MTSKPKLRGHLLSLLNYTIPKSPRSKAIYLGVKTSFTELPVRICLGDRSNYLVRGEAGSYLLIVGDSISTHAEPGRTRMSSIGDRAGD